MNNEEWWEWAMYADVASRTGKPDPPEGYEWETWSPMVNEDGSPNLEGGGRLRKIDD